MRDSQQELDDKGRERLAKIVEELRIRYLEFRFKPFRYDNYR